MIEQLIKKYSDFYEGKAYTVIADIILEQESHITLSHRTIRRYIGEYMSSKNNCCGDTDTKVCQNCPNAEVTYETSSWTQENTIDYFKGIKESKRLTPYLSGDISNKLIIGDIHTPFTREGYLEHCLETQKKFNCGEVIFIGDILDSCFSSFHSTIPDGYGAGEELDRAINMIQEWYTAFPVAKVCLGNHDLIALRKGIAGGLSTRWIRGLDEVLNTPNWTYELEFEIDGVLYTHGTGSSGQNAAYNRALNWRKSIVQGHLHTESNIRYNVSSQDIIFGMQVGCGIDDEAYAFSYAKGNARKSIISCAVVLNSGKLPILVPMEL